MGTERDTAESAAKKQKEFVSGWLEEIENARKREKHFRKEGREIVKIYEADQVSENSFNILYSNTETLSPALYNSCPRPVVKRRGKGDDPIGTAASSLEQLALVYLLDTEQGDNPTFDELMQVSVQQALVPGRGIVRFKYDATFSEETKDAPKQVTSESVLGETVQWDRFLTGFARSWKEVPWVAFEVPMGKEELIRNFGEALTAKMELVDIEVEATDEENSGKALSSESSVTKGAWVLEIWDKTAKEVVFLSPSYKDAPLRQVPDPLKLFGFFPCPKPLTFFRRINSLTPVALYEFYEEQAKELNRITMRINKLILALKVRGVYDSTVSEIEKVFEAEDNTFVPASNVAALQQGMSLEKALFLMPIEKLIEVLRQLYAQRVEVKQVIYEITGIADIMRGSTAASETLGAQQIKNQWGTLRMKRAQKEVARYARDCLRIMGEIATTKLAPATLKAMTGISAPLLVEKQQAQAQLQQFALSGQQPPQNLIAIAQAPAIEDMLQLLQNDVQRSYQVEIETNSTVDSDASEDKRDIAELMQALSQFLNGVSPAVEKGVLPFEAAKGLLLGIIKPFRFGQDVEEVIKSMRPPQQPNGAAIQEQQKQLQALQKQLETEKAQLLAERQQFEMDKKLAEQELAQITRLQQKEIDQQVKFALEEVRATSERSEAEGEHAAKMREDRISALEKDFQRKISKEAANKSQQKADNDQQVLIGAILAGLEKLAGGQKRAVKQPDGSWLTEKLDNISVGTSK